MKCPNCETDNKDGARYCKKCGSDLSLLTIKRKPSKWIPVLVASIPAAVILSAIIVVAVTHNRPEQSSQPVYSEVATSADIKEESPTPEVKQENTIQNNKEEEPQPPQKEEQIETETNGTIKEIEYERGFTVQNYELAINQTIVSEYDENGYVLRTSIYDKDNKLVRWHEYTRNKDGVSIKSCTYNDQGIMESHSECETDAEGNRLYSIDYNDNGSISENWYDTHDQIVKTLVTDSDKTTSLTEYEREYTGDKCTKETVFSNGELSKTICRELDSNGYVIKSSTYAPDGNVKSWTEIERGPMGNETRNTTYGPDGSIESELTRTYDSSGKMLEFGGTRYYYDEWGRLSCIAAPDYDDTITGLTLYEYKDVDYKYEHVDLSKIPVIREGNNLPGELINPEKRTALNEILSYRIIADLNLLGSVERDRIYYDYKDLKSEEQMMKVRILNGYYPYYEGNTEKEYSSSDGPADPLNLYGQWYERVNAESYDKMFTDVFNISPSDINKIRNQWPNENSSCYYYDGYYYSPQYGIGDMTEYFLYFKDVQQDKNKYTVDLVEVIALYGEVESVTYYTAEVEWKEKDGQSFWSVYSLLENPN